MRKMFPEEDGGYGMYKYSDFEWRYSRWLLKHKFISRWERKLWLNKGIMPANIVMTECRNELSEMYCRLYENTGT